MAVRMLVLASLAIAAAVHVASAQVTDGCSIGGPAATAANAFFTTGGACFAVTPAEPGIIASCASVCGVGGLGCGTSAGSAGGSAAECEAVLTAFTNSPGAPGDMPASPATFSALYCLIHRTSPSDPYQVSVKGAGFPLNSMQECTAQSVYGDGSGTTMLVCECVLDVTAPTLAMTYAAQASASSVTIIGTTDEAATVYCAVTAAADSAPSASDLKSSGSAASAGASFTVTVTGVAGEGSKTVYCVGEDAAGNLGASPASTSFDFDQTGPTLSGITASTDGSNATVLGSSDDAGTVHCMVDAPGLIKSAASVVGVNVTLASAGVFTAWKSGAHQRTDSWYCVGEDALGNFGAVVEASLNQPPTDIALSSSTVAENAAEGTDVGSLTTTDADATDTATYTIVTQAVVNAFKVSGDKLQAGSGTLDFEATPSIAVTLRSTDSGGLTFDKTFTVTVSDVNEAPTDITVTTDSSNLATLGIITAALVVAAGFVFAFYMHGGSASAQGSDATGAGSQA